MALRIVRWWAAAVLVAAGSAVLPPAPGAQAAAGAAACPGTTGVTAFVDFAELGGGVTGGCDQDGGGDAAVQVFRDAGYTLEYSQQPGMNGFVCKVQGKPADGDCAADDAFWSLWWSDGESGRWVFSNRGVASLEVPDGGYVAWAWHQGSGNAQPPAVVPTAHPDPEPTDDGGPGGTGGSGGGAGGDDVAGGSGRDPGGDDAVSSGPTSAAPSATGPSQDSSTTSAAGAESSPRRERKRAPRSDAATDTAGAATTSTVPGAAEITAGPPSSDLATDTSDDAGGALTTWIGLGLAVLVLGAAGLVTVVRRRAG